MSKDGGLFFPSRKRKAARRYWQQQAQAAADMPLNELRTLKAESRNLLKTLMQFQTVAETRMALPRLGNQLFPKPAGTDWAWRPTPWCVAQEPAGQSSVASGFRFGDEIAIFHDCSVSEITLRQVRNTREMDLAAFGMRLDVFKFTGSYLSMAIDLPNDVISGLTRDHVLRCDTIVETEKPLEIFARLNIKHGPNTEQLVQELPLQAQDIRAEFDLAYSKINEKRVEKAWLDLIFENPTLNQVTLRDLTFSRRRRAKL